MRAHLLRLSVPLCVVQEVQRAEQALVMSQQECHSLRDLLVAARLETAAAGSSTQQSHHHHQQQQQWQLYDRQQQQQRRGDEGPGDGSAWSEVAGQPSQSGRVSSKQVSTPSTEAAVAAAIAAAATRGWLPARSSSQTAAAAAVAAGGDQGGHLLQRSRGESDECIAGRRRSSGGLSSSSQRAGRASTDSAGAGLAPGEGYSGGLQMQEQWEREVELLSRGGADMGEMQRSGSSSSRAPPPAHALFSSRGSQPPSRPWTSSSSSEATGGASYYQGGRSRGGRQKSDSMEDAWGKENVYFAGDVVRAAGGVGSKQMDWNGRQISESLDCAANWMQQQREEASRLRAPGVGLGARACAAGEHELAPPLELEDSLLATYMASRE